MNREPGPPLTPNPLTAFTSQQALVLTRLQRLLLLKACPLPAATCVKLAPLSMDRNSPKSVATRTISFGPLVSTFTSRTLNAPGRFTNGLQLLPPSVDLTITPAMRPRTSKGSPTPRYSVSGVRPNATAPPVVLITESV